MSVRTRLVGAAATVAYHSGLLRAMVAASGRVALRPSPWPLRRQPPIFQILTYHHVNDERDPFFPAVATRDFERQMTWVARAYCVRTVEDLVEATRRDRVPANALAITFDDGYRDTLTHAAPILARLGLPATVFLATGFIGAAELPWYDRLAVALKHTCAPALAVPGMGRWQLDATAARLRALDALLAHLKRVPDDVRRSALDGILDDLAVRAEKTQEGAMLSWDDVSALRGLGFSIGAHTVTHPILSRLDEAQAAAEVEGSRAAIAAACGASPAVFAYPNGQPEDYTPAVQRLVAAAGFTCAVTTRFGVNTRESSPYELRRGTPWEGDLPSFALKLAWYRLTHAGGTGTAWS